MNCGSEKGWFQHKAANTPLCKWCAPYNPKLAQPKKQRVVPAVRKKPGPKPKPQHRARVLGEITHGTVWGYQQHKARGDDDCPSCRESANNKRREYNARKAATQ